MLQFLRINRIILTSYTAVVLLQVRGHGTQGVEVGKELLEKNRYRWNISPTVGVEPLIPPANLVFN